MHSILRMAIAIAAAGTAASCGPKEPVVKIPVDTTKQQVQVNVQAPVFNADSAYMNIEKQLSFGPRVPNSKGHKQCADYLVAFMKSLAGEVIVQEATVTAYNGDPLKIKNIIARFQPEKTDRILLFAHWDTRPFSDNDSVNPKKPVPGADDGASGVAVLMEIAKHLKAVPPTVGVDIIFFDGEDYGDASGAPETYCLGAQYWARNPPIANYYAKYGILLDMVGAKDARFCKEGYSLQYASSVVENVWNTANQLGYGNYFLLKNTNPITDDHVFVNSIARIPSIDIVNFDTERGGFGSHWHTQQDDLPVIDKNVLKAVGQTLLQVIYNESSSS